MADEVLKTKDGIVIFFDNNDEDIVNLPNSVFWSVEYSGSNQLKVVTENNSRNYNTENNRETIDKIKKLIKEKLYMRQ